jgi:hypothetical protein
MSKSLRRAALVAILAFGVIITLGSQQLAFAQSGGGIAHEVFCSIDGQFENTGVPLMPIFGTECPEGELPTACSDGLDNDGDLLVDLNDPGCTDGSDNDESNTITPEPGQCEDGDDNDTDGFTDSTDPNCHTDGDPTNADSYNPDGTEAGALSQCYDGIDNDDDGTTDWGVPGDENRDTDCSTPLDDSEAGEGNEEPTTGTITVQKVFGSGTTTPSSFSFTINGIMTTAFEADGENVLTLSPGTYTIAEVATSTYTASYSLCSEIVLTAGQAVTCVITNNAVVTPPPQTPACSDGSDNDEDGKTDMSDPGCSSAEDNDETDPVQPPPSGGGTPANGPIATGGGGGGGGNGPIAGSAFGLTGQVLGSATTTPAGCTALLNGYMRMGRRDNNVDDVKKLQQFLNDHMGANLPVTGHFGSMTDKAVRAFQAKYMSEVLTPWGIDAPTGFVYKTTMRWINMMHCATLNIPIPSPLTPFKENE